MVSYTPNPILIIKPPILLMRYSRLLGVSGSYAFLDMEGMSVTTPAR